MKRTISTCFLLVFTITCCKLFGQNIIRYSFAPGPGKTTDPGTILYFNQLDAMRKANNATSTNQPATNFKFNYVSRKQALKAEQLKKEKEFEAFVKESNLKDIKARTIMINNKPEVMDYYPRYFSSHLKIVTKNRKFGLYDPANGGSLALPIAFDYFSYPHLLKTAICGKDGKFGLVSDKGTMILPVEYDHIMLFSDSLFLVDKNDQSGLTDLSGNPVLPPEFIEIQPLQNGSSIVVNRAKKFGVIDGKGRFLMPAALDYAEKVQGQKLIISRNNKFELFDLARNKSGSIYKYSSLIHLPYSRVLYGKVYDKNIHHFISYNGIPLAGDIREIKEMPEYPHGYYIKENNKWGVLDLAFAGMVLPAIPAIYDSILKFDMEKGIFEAILNGEKVTKNLNVKGYARRRPFVNERAAVSNGEGWGFINYDGKLEIPMAFEDVGNFNKETGLWNEDLSSAPAKEQGKWGFISIKGKWLVPAVYDEVTDFGPYCARVRKGNKWFLIERNNKLMTPTGYDYIDDNSGIIYAVKNQRGKWGLIDRFGKTKLPIKFEEIKMLHHNEDVQKKEKKIIYYRNGNQWYLFDQFADPSKHKKVDNPF